MYYTVGKHDRHLRTRGKCKKHKPQASDFYISRMFSNAQIVLSQCYTTLYNMLYDFNQTTFIVRYLLWKDDRQKELFSSYVGIVIISLIVSLTKFSLVIGYRAPICHVIGAWSGGCPITGVRFELFVIGDLRDFHVNYVRIISHINTTHNFFHCTKIRAVCIAEWRL